MFYQSLIKQTEFFKTFLRHVDKLSGVGGQKGRGVDEANFFHGCKLHYKKLANCWIGKIQFHPKRFSSDRVSEFFGIDVGVGVGKNKNATD